MAAPHALAQPMQNRTPSNLRRPRTAAIQLVAAAALGTIATTAQGGFELALPSSHLAFDLSSLPVEFRTGDFSLLMWVWIETPETPGVRTLATIPGRFELRANADGRLSASLLRVANFEPLDTPGRNERLKMATPILENQEIPDTSMHAGPGRVQPAPVKLQRLTATTSAPVGTGVWTLLCVSMDRNTGTLRIQSRSDGGSLTTGLARKPDWASFRFNANDRMFFGTSGGDSFLGQIGLAVFRPELVTSADLDSVFSSRRLLGPFDTDRRASGGTISGESGALWMIGHSMPTYPRNGAGGSTFERAAIPGRLVNRTNVTVYSDFFNAGAQWSQTGPVALARDVFFRGASDGRYAGFFVRDRYNSGVGPGWVPGSALNAGELLNATPSRQIRVIASANSRGVKNFDGSGLSPGNYAHGFIEKYRSQTSGILMRPAVLTSGGNPWFGFDCSLANPAQSAPGTIIDIAVTTDNAGDFGRFFTGSAAYGRAPGAGLFMLPGSTYTMRCRAENLSLLVATAPLDVDAYVLAFPGASDLRYRSDRGSNQQGTGSVGPWQTAALDTARVTLTPDPIIFQTQTVLAFFGDQRPLIQIGDACVVTSGPGARSISLVQSIAYDGIRTRITLQKPLLQAPTSASTVKIGSWELRTIRVSFGAQSPSDPHTWRGIGFEAAATGVGTPVFAFSAVRPDVPGFVFGTAGWGGHGYQQQIDASFAQANVQWMALSQADVWFQIPAQQLSTPPVMSAFTALVRAALPACDIIWAGESGLFADPAFAWHQYILDQAQNAGVIGLSLLEHPRVGDLREQYADGMLADNDHYSQRGNRRLADLWVAQLRQALRPGCPGDYDQSGVLDANDLLAFQADLSALDPDADVNADGLVDAADLTTFLDAFSQGC